MVSILIIEDPESMRRKRCFDGDSSLVSVNTMGFLFCRHRLLATAIDQWKTERLKAFCIQTMEASRIMRETIYVDIYMLENARVSIDLSSDFRMPSVGISPLNA